MDSMNGSARRSGNGNFFPLPFETTGPKNVSVISRRLLRRVAIVTTGTSVLVAALWTQTSPSVTVALMGLLLVVVLVAFGSSLDRTRRLLNATRDPIARDRSTRVGLAESVGLRGDADKQGLLSERMRRSLRLRDDESAVLELIAADTDTPVVLRAITQLLANQFPGAQFRVASGVTTETTEADCSWLISPPSQNDRGWTLEAAVGEATVEFDPEVISLGSDLARLALDKARSRRSLRYLADHDALTGLLSRRAVLQALDAAMHSAQKIGLLYVDIDHFKSINDRFGHQAGDDLLVEISERLREDAAESTFDVRIGRLGGDEYLAVVTRADRREMDTFAERLAFAMRAPFNIGGVTISTSLSIGSSFTDTPELTSAEELLREADVALYQVKRHGRNAYRRFDEELRSWSREQQELEDDLAVSISKRSGIHAQFQPQFDHEQTLIGFEALGRWYRQGVGLVPPDQFLGVAAERGLMADFDHELFSHVANVLGQLRRDGRSFGLVSVNVSAERLERDDFVDSTLDLMRGSSIDPHSLILEITESSLLRDLAERGARLEKLRSWGVRIAVDDFGTGYSSLSYLRRLPVDIVKLDKEFVGDIDTSDQSRAIVRAILDLASALELTVVAEGVEREAQFEILRDLGCDIFQGYLLGKPLTLDDAKDVAERTFEVEDTQPTVDWDSLGSMAVELSTDLKPPK